jgi:radical SAM protein with 4Fe4S-binding SPASM domain
MPADAVSLELPKNLYVESTNRCNLKCKTCIQYRGNWEPQRDLSLAELVMITDQLPELEWTALHGIGEPLLNPALPDMIRHLKNRQVVVCLNSNGILLDEIHQNALIDAGLDELRISLDAASAEDYKAVRNSDKFDRIISNLRTFSNQLKLRTRSNPKISLWYLGNTENISELPEFLRLAASLEVDEVYLQRLVYFQDDEGYGLARAEKTLADSNAAAVEFIQKSQDLASQLGIQFRASGLNSPLQSLKENSNNQSPWTKCYRPTTLMYITANGNVLPCCISPFATSDYAFLILGNVFESSLAEIWSGAAYTNFRTQLQTATPPKSCQGCGVLWSL